MLMSVIDSYMNAAWLYFRYSSRTSFQSIGILNFQSTVSKWKLYWSFMACSRNAQDSAFGRTWPSPHAGPHGTPSILHQPDWEAYDSNGLQSQESNTSQRIDKIRDLNRLVGLLRIWFRYFMFASIMQFGMWSRGPLNARDAFLQSLRVLIKIQTSQ